MVNRWESGFCFLMRDNFLLICLVPGSVPGTRLPAWCLPGKVSGVLYLVSGDLCSQLMTVCMFFFVDSPVVIFYNCACECWSLVCLDHVFSLLSLLSMVIGGNGGRNGMFLHSVFAI